ncbi:MAG: DUF305 domain-containing protein, partial [Ornithinimicrobium sp.]
VSGGSPLTARLPARYAAVAAVSAALAALVAVLIASSGGGEGGDSLDAGFARDMGEHHAQAVDMSLIVLQTSESQDVDVLAYDIATTQSNQIGRMQSWLVDWDLPQARTEDRMAWMPEGSMAMDGMGMDPMSDAAPGSPQYRAMPGMASLAEMQDLRAAESTQAEILYLQLMITHHLAGVEMAEAAVGEGQDPDVVDLAQAMVNGQRSEVALMSDMLQARGASPREDLAALGYE